MLQRARLMETWQILGVYPKACQDSAAWSQDTGRLFCLHGFWLNVSTKKNESERPNMWPRSRTQGPEQPKIATQLHCFKREVKNKVLFFWAVYLSTPFSLCEQATCMQKVCFAPSMMPREYHKFHFPRPNRTLEHQASDLESNPSFKRGSARIPRNCTGSHPANERRTPSVSRAILTSHAKRGLASPLWYSSSINLLTQNDWFGSV